MTMFCPLKLEDAMGNKLWVQDSPNSPLTQRPLCLQMGKESVDSLQALKVFTDEINMFEDGGTVLAQYGEEIYNVKCDLKGWMMDRKAANLFTGLGGSYCDLCKYSKGECLDKNLVEEGFQITRDIEEINSIFEELVQDDGIVRKSKDDYAIQQGVTTKPIATRSVISQQVLHALLRCFDHYMKTGVHLKAVVYDWSESPSSINKGFLNKAKKDLQDRIYTDVHGTRWDLPDSAGKGGTTTNGNIARDFLHNPANREIIISEFPEHEREKMHKFGQLLSVIIRVLSKKKVDTHTYKELCTELYVFLLEQFPRVHHQHLTGPWISITPTLHKVLGHSWELIELNDSEGLGSLDESGLEGCNKILRKIRTNLLRKNSQPSNLVDTQGRMWTTSDPIVNDERKKAKPYCNHCVIRGHSTRYCKEKCGNDDNTTGDSVDDQLFNPMTYD